MVILFGEPPGARSESTGNARAMVVTDRRRLSTIQHRRRCSHLFVCTFQRELSAKVLLYEGAIEFARFRSTPAPR